MNNFFIKPNGHVIWLKQCSHEDFAYDYINDSYDINKSATEQLHEKGWVKGVVNSDGRVEIFGGCVNLTKPMKNTIDPAMNINQIISAKKICAENEYDFYKAINDKRFH
jgi:hypothetical protein